MTQYKKNNIYLIISLLILSLVSSCSTTRKLEEGDILYTGVKDFKVTPEKGEKVPDGVKSDLFDAINVKPNNPLYSPYMRTPLPIGLWVYNKWYGDSLTGLKKWIYNKFVEQPVLISSVKPKMRVKMMKSILDNNGYFSGSVNYEQIDNTSNNKKAQLSYFVNLDKPYNLSLLKYTEGDSQIEKTIDSLARKNKYLQIGNRYCTDSLSSVRVNIANSLRNSGYYFFRPEYIQFLADTIAKPGTVALKLVLADNISVRALQKYYVGKVTTRVYPYEAKEGGYSDTVELKNNTLIKRMPIRLRNSLIPSCVSLRPGRELRVRNIDRTQSNLSRIGIFSAVDIEPVSIDSVKEDNKIDININCIMDRHLEASIEAQLTSKSNSYLGPGIIGALTNSNLFGGGEKLTTQLTASYEWQTGKGGRSENASAFNSYEFGLKSTLSFPRLLAPKFIDRSRRYLNWTNISASADILNRPHFFRMVQFGTEFEWVWHANRNSLNEFTPFKLTYSKLLKHTPEFLAAMINNPAIYLSFQTQFIPMMSYAYTYDRSFNSDNKIVWSSSVSEAGNILSGIWSLAGKKGEKELFGTPFSQFVKAQSQLVYSHRFVKESQQWLVSRLLIGAAHAYGNSEEVPYSEQFYIGGANSIRAFAVRSIGPGSYHDYSGDKNSYYDQVGTFKLELNTEYRFHIFSYLHGAVFIDAGNIWLLKDDEYRPGGKINGKSFFKDIALGTGVGLRFDMDMLVIRGDLGIGIHAPYNTGKSGYYNMTSFKNSLAFHLAIGYPF